MSTVLLQSRAELIWTCDVSTVLLQSCWTAFQEEVIWTYDVEFVESPIKWASRWDTYLYMADDQIHWSVTSRSAVGLSFRRDLSARHLSRHR